MPENFESNYRPVGFLSGYRQAEARMRAQSMQDIQQAGALQQLLEHSQKQQREKKLEEDLLRAGQESGGDPAKTLQALLSSGTREGMALAAQMVPLLKQQQDAKLMQNLNTNDPEALRRLSFATGHAGAGLAADRLEMRNENRSQIPMMMEQPVGLPAGKVIPGTNQVETMDVSPADAAAVAQITRGQGIPTGEGMQATNQIASEIKGLAPPPPVLGGGLFSTLMGSESPAIATRAKQLQAMVTSSMNPSMVPFFQKEVDNLTAMDARFTQAKELQTTAQAGAQAGRQFTVDNRVIAPRAIDAIPPEHSHLTGQEYLDTLPKGKQNTIKAVADGKIPLTTFSTRNNERDAMVQMATQYDPTFEAGKAPARMSVQKDFTSGVTARNITSNNMAISHLGTFYELGQAIENGDVRIFNTIKNRLAHELGRPELNNLAMTSQAVGEELMRVFRQVNASESEARMFMEKLGTSSSPAQFKGAVSTAVELMRGRLDSLNDQWKRGMDKDTDFPNIVSEKSQAVLKKMGMAGKLGGETAIPEFATASDAVKAGVKIGDRVKIGGVLGTWK